MFFVVVLFENLIFFFWLLFCRFFNFCLLGIFNLLLFLRKMNVCFKFFVLGCFELFLFVMMVLCIKLELEDLEIVDGKIEVV